MISDEDNWNKLVEKIEDKLDDWKLLDKSRVTYTSPIEDGYKENEYIRYIPIKGKLEKSQLEELKKLNHDLNWTTKTPELEERFNEEGIWLMIY